VQHDNYLTYSQWNITDAIIVVTTLYRNNEFYDAMTSLDDVLSSPYSWLNKYSMGFDEVTIPNMVPEAILNGVAMLESVSESGSTCKNNWRVVPLDNCNLRMADI